MAPERVVWLRPASWHRGTVGQRLVRRPRLLDRLSRAPLGTVVLITGPPGSGKSVLLQSWVEATGLGDRVAWVSVERGERDAQRMWMAVIDELTRTVGRDGLVSPVSPAPGLLTNAIVEQLIADLEGLAEPVVLVIDDLHELESPEGLDCVATLVARMPARMRLMLGTRVEPRLGLHRLRLAGALTEIRGRDLRFSPQETRELLEEAGVTLSDRGIAVLHAHTEGWAAGLRLAALSLADHPDPERFVCEFSGSNRAVADYLVTEVLDHQTPVTRDLLLRTSVLDRVNCSLANALTGLTTSQRVLQCLEDHNAFVTSLDAARTWFRYHRLFADLLGNELRRAAPTTRIRALHRAAAQWWEEHGYAVEAVRHAQAAHDWENAARMMSDHNLDLLLDGRVGTIRALVEAFPSNVRTRDPGLAIVSAGVAISDGLLGDAQVYLDHARRHAPEVPEKLRRRFELRLASGELWLASWRGDMEGVLGPMRALEEALAAPTPEELARDNDTHASALMNLGIAELWSSRLDDARRHLEQALDLARRIRRPYIEVNVLAHLGIALALTGSPLSATEELADEAIALGEAHGWGKNRVLDAALAARGTVLVWLGRFDEAERSVRRAEHTLRSDREPGLAFVVHYATALLHAVHGRFEEALAALTAAESARRILASEHTLSLELDSRMIRTQVALGNTAAARTSLERIAPPLRERTIIRTAEATLLLAEGDPPGAIDVLAPALAGSPLRHIPWPLIQALLCDAAARTQLGDTRGATASLDRALEIAEPEQVILPFVLPPARDLMLDRARHGSATSPLLAAILEVLADSPAAPGPELPPEAEELSPAELRVLGFLPSDLNAGEIADRLYVSPNTVRTHVRHIYSKLAAHNRRQAVARARELGLLVRR